MNGKKANVVSDHKKVIGKCQEFTDLFHYFQYVERCPIYFLIKTK